MRTPRSHSETMYSRFLFKKSHKTNDILHDTKNLTLDTNNYSNYVDNYNLKTQKICYKEPHHEVYPILQNKDYIPLQKQKNIFENYHSQKVSNTKKKIKDKFLLISNSKNNEENKSFKAHQRNFTIITTTTDANKSSFNFFRKNSKTKRLMTANEYILCDLLFYEDYYNGLEYNEEIIFHRKSYYIELLKEKIIKLKSSPENRLNVTSELMHKFFNQKFGKIELSLDSIKIELKNVSNKYRPLTFDVPFDYIPLFFLGRLEDMKQMFIEFFVCEDEFLGKSKNKNNISFNLEYLKENIFSQFDEKGRIISFYKNLYIDVDLQAKKENLFNNAPTEEYIKLIKTESQENYKRHFKIINDYTNQYNEKRNYIIFNSSVKRYGFYWININGKYSVKITMPNINLRFVDMKKYVNLFIDKELLVYLLEKQFVNWDFYVVHYLFSIKSFRIFIQNILSKKSLMVSRNISNLKSPFVNNYQLNKMGDKEFFSMSNTYNSTLNCSLNDLDYSFIMTDYTNTEKNYFFKLFSYTIYIQYLSFGDEIHKFTMNFHQMKIMYLRNKKENLEKFILKLLYINTKTKSMYLDYSYFSIFNDFSNEQIEEYFNQLDLKYDYDYENLQKMEKTKILILPPHFEIVQVRDKDVISVNSTEIWQYCKKEIEENLLIQLINNKMDDWPEIIYKYQLNLEQIFAEYNHFHIYKSSKTLSPSPKKSTSKSKKSILTDKLTLNFSVLKKKSNK